MVEQYELDPLAGDGEDERRLRKAAGFATEQDKIRIIFLLKIFRN